MRGKRNKLITSVIKEFLPEKPVREIVFLVQYSAKSMVVVVWSFSSGTVFYCLFPLFVLAHKAMGL